MNNYPRELHVDFSKLNAKTLKRYVWYFKIDSKAELRPELATQCAKHFMTNLDVDEAHVLSSFEAYIENPNSVNRSGSMNGVNTSGPSGTGPGGVGSSLKRPLPSPSEASQPAKKKRLAQVVEGKLVVAKCNENWILCRVLKFLKRKKAYKVEDADEMTKDKITFEVPQELVLPLLSEEEVSNKKPLTTGDRVLARFPKTSTFYPATVVKKAEKTKYSLRFDDDERGPDGKIRLVKVSGTEVVLEP